MIQKLVLQIIAGIIGLWLAQRYVTGVEFIGPFSNLVIAGVAIGLVNSVVKPIVNLITLPLRLLTFGLFGIVVNMAMLWIVDVLFPELVIEGLVPLFWATIIIWLTTLFLSLIARGKV